VLIMEAGQDKLIGVVIIGLALVGLVISVFQTRHSDRKLEPMRHQLDMQEYVSKFDVLTRSTRPWGFSYSPLRGITRVELTLYGEYVRLRLPSTVRRFSWGRECIFLVASTRMRMSTLRFTPFKRRRCIIITGQQMGREIEQIIYSKEQVELIWHSFLQLGIVAVTT
jgi:hypothetical protein